MKYEDNGTGSGHVQRQYGNGELREIGFVT
jgi:hypothetical protein